MQNATARRETVLRLPVVGAQLKHHPLAIVLGLIGLRHFGSFVQLAHPKAPPLFACIILSGWGSNCRAYLYLQNG